MVVQVAVELELERALRTEAEARMRTTRHANQDDVAAKQAELYAPLGGR